MSDELEIGHELDQLLRATITGVAQLVERASRRRQNADREAAQHERWHASQAAQNARWHASQVLQRQPPSAVLSTPRMRLLHSLRDQAEFDSATFGDAVRAWETATALEVRQPGPVAARALRELGRKIKARWGIDLSAMLTAEHGARAAQRAGAAQDATDVARGRREHAATESEIRSLPPGLPFLTDAGVSDQAAYAARIDDLSDLDRQRAHAALDAFHDTPTGTQAHHDGDVVAMHYALESDNVDEALRIFPGANTADEENPALDEVDQIKMGLLRDTLREQDRGVSLVAEERGYAPSKAPNQRERKHRAEAWKAAEHEFRATLPADTPAHEAAERWKQLDWRDKSVLYWRAYDSPDLRQSVGLPPTPPATRPPRPPGPQSARPQSTPATSPAAVPTPRPKPQPDWGISRARTVELNTMAADYYAGKLTGSRAQEYLHARLGGDIVGDSRWTLGYAPAGWTTLTDHLRQAGASDTEIVESGLGKRSSRGTVIDVFRDRAMLGIKDRHGELVGFIGRDLSEGAKGAPKYLNTGSTPAFTKGEHLYGLWEAPAKARLVRTEGPFDAIPISAASNGEYAGVAPLGTALTPTQADLLAERGQTVWEALDGDRGGQRAVVADYWALSERGIDLRHLAQPEGSDPAAVWERDPEALRQQLAAAHGAPSAALVVMDNAIEQRLDEIVAGEEYALEALGLTHIEVDAGLSAEDSERLHTHVRARVAELQSEAEANRNRALHLGEVEDQALVRSEQTADTEESDELERRADHAHSQQDQLHDRAVHTHITADATDSASEQPRPRYNRAADIPQGVSRDAREARQVSAYGYSRSTRDMLADNEQRARSAKPRPTKPGGPMGRVRTHRR